MPHYLLEASFEATAVKRLIDRPQSREDVVRAALQSLGGRLLHVYFCFGEYDIIALAELPNNEAAMSFSMVAAGGGAITKLHTRVLLTTDEAMRAMEAAGKVPYTPPQ